MPISPVASLAAIAAGKAVGQVAVRFADALSFADVLRGGEGSSAAKQQSAEKPGASGLAGETLHLDELRSDAQSRLQRFQQDLARGLAAAGIHTRLSFRLQSDGRGGVILADDHPLKQQIEQVLHADPELAGQFNSLAGTLQLLQAAEQISTSPEFSAAKTLYLRIDGEKIEVEFE